MNRLNPDGAMFRLNETYLHDMQVTCIGAVVPLIAGNFVIKGRVPDSDAMKADSVAKMRSDVIHAAIDRLDQERKRLTDLLEEHDAWDLLDGE